MNKDKQIGELKKELKELKRDFKSRQYHHIRNQTRLYHESIDKDEIITEFKNYNIWLSKANLLNPCCNHFVDLMYKEGLDCLRKMKKRA